MKGEREEEEEEEERRGGGGGEGERGEGGGEGRGGGGEKRQPIKRRPHGAALNMIQKKGPWKTRPKMLTLKGALCKQGHILSF